MDFCLFVASACLPGYCVGHVAPSSRLSVRRSLRISSIQIVLALSFCLLSVSVLEVSPSSWMVILQSQEEEEQEAKDELMDKQRLYHHINRHHYVITIASAYRILLSLFSLMVILILPSLIGVRIINQMNICILPERSQSLTPTVPSSPARMDREDDKKRSYFRVFPRSNSRQSNWIVRLLYRTIWLLISVVRLFLRTISVVSRRICCPARATSISGRSMTLPLTHQQKLETTSPWLRFCNLLRIFLCFPRQNILGIIMGIATTVTLLSTIAPFVVKSNHDTTINNYADFSYVHSLWHNLPIFNRSIPLLSTAVSWMCSVGIVISAVLNGFGSVAMPHSCLAGLYLEPIRQESIAHAEAELAKTNEALEDRKVQLSGGSINVQQQQQQQQQGMSSSVSSSSLNTPLGSSRHVTSFGELGDEFVQRRKLLQSEISFLETLSDELTEDVAEMRQSQNLAAMARTPLGRLRSWLGVVFSVILLLKLVSSVVSTWPGNYVPHDDKKNRHKDIVTRVLLWLVGHHYVTHEEYNALSQLVSLVLTAILSFSQVNTFLQTMTAVSHRLQTYYRKCNPLHKSNSRSVLNDEVTGSGNTNGTSFLDPNSTGDLHEDFSPMTGNGIYAHLVACLMGCYFLACIVLTKTMLPHHYRIGFSAALGGDVFQVRAYAINLTFVVSSLLSLVILGMLLAIQRQNTKRHKSLWTTEGNSATTMNSEQNTLKLMEP